MSTPVLKLFDLTGKTALVTGGSRGLGLQIAEALHRIGGNARDLRRLARVGSDPERVDAFALQLRGRLLEIGRLARRQQHARAGLAERLGDLQAEPA